MKPTILLTGSSGFIGSQAAQILQKRDVDLHVVAHEHGAAQPGVLSHAADLLSEKDQEKLFAAVKPTHILHFAWVATPGVYWTSPLNEDWKNATIDLLARAKKSGVKRFVGAGSCAEYDWSGGIMDERETPLKSLTPYGKAKAECGEAVMSGGNGVSTAWGRIFHLYGPHEYPSRLVPSVIQSLLAGDIAKCTHGEQVRDFLHVVDVASAFVSLLFSSVTGPVNIGSGNPVTIKHVAETIQRECNVKDRIEFGAVPAPKTDPPVLVPLIERLQKEVGWKPSISLEQGLHDTVEWWRNHRIASNG